jgi:hypothetical protein
MNNNKNNNNKKAAAAADEKPRGTCTKGKAAKTAPAPPPGVAAPQEQQGLKQYSINYLKCIAPRSIFIALKY